MIQSPSPRKSLSLDIPSGYSNVASQSSPPSPASFVGSPVFSPPRQFEGSVPPSPTFSASFNVSKTQAELTVMLKEAYSVIREREKDLMLAAEIGKSLLENNMTLKSKYEDAIVDLQQLQRERSKAQTFTLQHQFGDKHATPIAPPNNSLNPFPDDQLDYDESDNESQGGWSTSLDLRSSSRVASLNRKPLQNSGLNFKDLESLKELESRNQELQQQLDEALKEFSETDKSNKFKIRKLESDLVHFQDSCTSATQKVEDLEKENDRLKKKQTEDFWNLKYNKKSDDNDDYIDALVHKVQELEEQNYVVEKSKIEIERRLVRASNELENLKEEYEEMTSVSKDYEQLQLIHRDQEKLIAELSESLEEERSNVVRYRSGMGMWSQKTSRANSISDGGIMSNALRRLSDASLKQGQDGIGGKIRKTLLSELENEWFRELTIFQRDVKKGRSDSDVSEQNFMPISSEKDLNDFFMRNGARPDDEMDYLSDDEFSFLDEFEVDNEKAIRLREWFWKRWIRAVFRFLRTIWRWCRFIVILIAAVIMALYRGPDDILPNDM